MVNWLSWIGFGMAVVMFLGAVLAFLAFSEEFAPKWVLLGMGFMLGSMIVSVSAYIVAQLLGSYNNWIWIIMASGSVAIFAVVYWRTRKLIAQGKLY